MSLISSLLDKPLRPIFITPDSMVECTFSKDYYNVILLTASTIVPCGHKRIDGFVYVQGAADDEEAWSHGLTSSQFWNNNEMLLNCTREDDLVKAIQEIMSDSSTT